MTDHDTGVERSMEADLVRWGRIITLHTLGRRSGRPRRVRIGFVEEPSGDLLVAASDEHVDWAQNLMAQPRCEVERAGVRSPYRAMPLASAERAGAVSALILKYGTPAERLGGGPAFRLAPLTTEA